MDTFLSLLTDEEFAYFFSSDFSLELTKMAAENNPDVENRYLAKLYHLRGDDKKCREHLAAIKSDECRSATTLLIYEIVE